MSRWITGGRGDDTLQGTNGSDRVWDRGGNNTIDTGGGHDKVWTGRGDDTISTGSGNDRVYDRGGDNLIDTGDGHDWVRTGSGDDTITSGDGWDVVYAGNGDNVVDLGSGGGLVITGHGEDDITLGSKGYSKVFAGRGDDTVTYQYDGQLHFSALFGGRGHDTLVLDVSQEIYDSTHFQNELACFEAYRAAEGRPFYFCSLNIFVTGFEAVQVLVDGMPVNPGDNPVTAGDDSATVREDDMGVLQASVLANDTALDGMQSVTLVSGPARGALQLNADGTYTFDPAGAFDALAVGEMATVSFTYEVIDVDGDSDQATVTITVIGDNDAPVVVPANLALLEDDQPVQVDLLAGASDADAGAVLSVENLQMLPDGVSVSGTILTVDPGHRAFQDLADGEVRTLTIAYDVVDDQGAAVGQTLEIQVTGQNDVPLVSAEVTATANEDDLSFSLDLLMNASDPDSGAVLSVTDVSALPAGVTLDEGMLTVVPSDPVFQSLAAGETAEIIVTYRVTDDQGASVPQTAVITITGSNDAPVVSGQITADADEDDPAFSIDMLENASDIDGGASLSVTNVSPLPIGVTRNGTTLSVDTTNPAFQALVLGELLELEIEFDVTDNNGGSVPQTVIIEIRGSNDAPMVSAEITATAGEDDAAFSVDLLQNADDADSGAVLSVQNVSALPDGMMLNGTTLVVDPSDPAFQSLDSTDQQDFVITYEVVDETGLAINQTATITIGGKNDAPVVAVINAGQVTEDDALQVIDLLAGQSDPDDGAVLTAQNVSATDDLGNVVAFTDNGDGTISIDPLQYDDLDDGESRTITVSYDVSDGTAQTPNTAVLTVDGVTDQVAPVAVDDVLGSLDIPFLPEDDNSVFGASDLLLNDTDENSDPLFVIDVAGAGVSGVGTSTLGADVLFNGSFVDYVARSSDILDALAQGEVVEDSFTYTISDGNGGTDTATVTVFVGGVNDAPNLTVSAPASIQASDFDATAPSAGLLAYYDFELDFDNVAGTVGAGGEDFDATLINIPQFNPGVGNGTGLEMNLMTGLVMEGLDTELPTGDAARTLSFWARPGTVSNGVNLVSWGGDSAGEAFGLTLDVDGSLNLIGAGAPLTVGQVSSSGFQHVAVTFDGDALAVYIDGVETFSGTGFELTNTGDDLAVGGFPRNEGLSFQGGFDELRVYDRALSAAEVEALSQTTRPVSQSGTVTFDDVDNGAVVEVTATYNNDGAYSGTGVPAQIAELVAGFALESATPSASGTINWTFDADLSSDLSFMAEGETITFSYTVTATDEFGGTRSQVVTFTVNGANDAPTTMWANTTLNEDAGPRVLSSGATDVDDTALTFTTDTTGTLGEVVDLGNGQFSYDPNGQFEALRAGEQATDTFTYTATDDSGASDTTTVTVTVNGRNDAAMIGGDTTGAVVEDGEGLKPLSLAPFTNMLNDAAATVAISGAGERILLGDFVEDGIRPTTGAAVVFEPDGQLFATLQASDGATSDSFGVAVAISEDGGTFVVGALGDDDGGASSGSVYIFDAAGTERAKLTAPDAASGHNFGEAVAISANGAVIAAGASGAQGSAGAVYLFDNNGQQLVQISLNDGENGDAFGKSLALSGDGSKLLVGASNDDDGGINSGSAFLYAQDGTLIQKITAPTPANDRKFGTDLAISDDGETIVVLEGFGRVHVFDGQGVFSRTLTLENGQAQLEASVVAVAGQGTHIAVGSPVNDTVYVFDASGAIVSKLSGEGLPATARFGANLAFSSDGQTLVVASSGNALDLLPTPPVLTFERNADGNFVDHQGNVFGPDGLIGTQSLGASTASGQLTIADVDTGEAAFQPIVSGTDGDNGFGTFEVAADGNWTYTLDNARSAVQALAEGQEATDTITVLSIDGTEVQLEISVTGTNDAPVLQAQTIEVPQDSAPTAGQLVGTDPDAGETVTWVDGTTTSPNGELVVAPDGSFTYTPNPGFNGVEIFEVSATDPNGETSTTELRVEVATETTTTPGGQEVTIDLNADPVDGAPYGSLSIALASYDAPAINVAIAMDSSGSVQDEGWAQTLDAVSRVAEDLATRFDGSGIDVDLHIYSFSTGNFVNNGGNTVNRQTVEFVDGTVAANVNSTSFLIGEYVEDVDLSLQALPALQSDIAGMTYLGGQTPWDTAFEQAEGYFDAEFQQDGLDAQNFLLFITDGNPRPSSQEWEQAYANLVNQPALGKTPQDNDSYSVNVQAVGVGSSLTDVFLDQVDSDGELTEVEDFDALSTALSGSGFFPAELASLELRLEADGVDLGVIADENSPALQIDTLSIDLALADIAGIEDLLGDDNELALTAVFDLDNDASTTDDQVTLTSYENISGGSDSLTITGTDGNDLILGSSSADLLSGGLGADVILSQGGGDQITGGLGDDIMKAGAGADVFQFAAGDGSDRLVDFDTGEDIIAFSGGITFEDLLIADEGAGVTISYGTDEISVGDGILAEFVEDVFMFS